MVSVEADDKDPFASEEDKDEECINELWIEEDMDAGADDGTNGTSSEDDSDN